MYLWNAIYTRNTLYIVGNVIGLILNSIMIGLILLLKLGKKEKAN